MKSKLTAIIGEQKPILQFPFAPAKDGRSEPTNDVFKEAPLMKYYSDNQEFRSRQPFEGLRVIFLLHLLTDLLPFLQAMVKLGLDTNSAYFFFKDYSYPDKEDVLAILKNAGFMTRPRTEIDDDFIRELLALHEIEPKKILIIEDGGYISPRILANEILSKMVIGAVEQTTRGTWNLESAIRELEKEKPDFPIIVLSPSKLKSGFEPPYVADGIVNSIETILRERGRDLRAKNVGIIGLGAIGGNVAKILLSKGARVYLYDKDPEKLVIMSLLGGLVSKTAIDLAQNSQIIIGASGSCSIDEDVISALKNGTFLVSASSERYEIDTKFLNQISTKTAPIYQFPKRKIDSSNRVIGTTYYLQSDENQVHLLGDGMPINFMGFGGMTDQASDLIMTLILLAAIDIVIEDYPKEIDREAIDKIQIKYKVAKMYLNYWLNAS